MVISLAYADDQQGDDGRIGCALTRAAGARALNITHVATNSPAANAGIQEGDLVTSINGASTKGMSSEEVHRACLGPIGSTIKLTILHAGSAEKEISVVKKSSLDCYLPAATAGDARAQFQVGCFYENRSTSKADLKIAADWYLKAAEQNYARAEAALGCLYRHGSGVDKDMATAIKWFREAAKQGNSYAERELGWAYLKGDGVPKNERDAFNWYYSAAEQDDTGAQNDIASLYRKGRGVNLSYRDAFNWYYRSAHLGNPFGKWGLAYMYEYGLGVTRNSGAAIRLYQRALEQLPDDKKLVRKVAELSMRAFFEDPTFYVLDLSYIHARFQYPILVITIIVALIYAGLGAILLYFSFIRPYQPRLIVAAGWIFVYMESQVVALFTLLSFATPLTIQTILQAIVIFGSLPVIASTLGTLRTCFWKPSRTSWKMLLIYLVASYLIYWSACIAVAFIYHLVTHSPLPMQHVKFMVIKAKHESFWRAFACIAVAIPMAEEIIFRGYFFDALKNRFSTKIAIGVTALVFSSMHFDLLSFIPLFTFGLTQGYVRYRTDSLRLPILMHMLNNCLILILVK